MLCIFCCHSIQILAAIEQIVVLLFILASYYLFSRIIILFPFPSYSSFAVAVLMYHCLLNILSWTFLCMMLNPENALYSQCIISLYKSLILLKLIKCCFINCFSYVLYRDVLSFITNVISCIPICLSLWILYFL